MLGPLAVDAHLPLLPQMTVDLHASPSWLQFTILSYSLIMAISSLFGGLLSDKHGRRCLTLWGLILFICGGFGCAFSTNIVTLNLCRCLQGIGGGISSITTSSVARDVFVARERMQILGILGCIRPIGVSIAPMIGGWIASHYGWNMIFFGTASFAVMVLVLSIWLLPETKNRFFVDFRKIHDLRVETAAVGNIDILEDSLAKRTTAGTLHSEYRGNLVVVDDDEDDEESVSDHLEQYEHGKVQCTESSQSTDNDIVERGYLEQHQMVQNELNEDMKWQRSRIAKQSTKSVRSAASAMTRNVLSASDLSPSSQSVQSIRSVIVGGDATTTSMDTRLTRHATGEQSTSAFELFPTGYCSAMCKMACTDGILMTVSWMLSLCSMNCIQFKLSLTVNTGFTASRFVWSEY